ncbi:MAG: cation diffusion facilitator family transporter [Thermodesulfovibrionales bacterium]
MGRYLVERGRAVRNVLIYTLIANSFVALAKVIFGYLTNSISILSDGFHSFFDGVSNIVGLIGISIASHPPDSRHPYGHRKYETLFTLIIAAMIFATCYQILRSAYESLSNTPKTTVTVTSFAIILITLSINTIVMLYETRKGKELGSEFLLADARHTKSDIFVSLSVLIGLLLFRAGYTRVDAIVGVVIALLIAKMGYEIIKEASTVLVDTVCIDTGLIEKALRDVEGVKGCHDIRTRGTIKSIFLDLHVCVRPDITLEEAHDIADRVEAMIKERFPDVVDIVVHVEPDKG